MDTKRYDRLANYVPVAEPPTLPSPQGGTRDFRTLFAEFLGSRNGRLAAALTVVAILGAGATFLILRPMTTGSGMVDPVPVRPMAATPAPNAQNAKSSVPEPVSPSPTAATADTANGSAGMAKLQASTASAELVPPPTPTVARDPKPAKKPKPEPVPQGSEPAPSRSTEFSRTDQESERVKAHQTNAAEERTPPGDASSGNGVDNFQEMEEVVNRLERLSGNLLNVYEKEADGSELADRLEEFQDLATDVRKAFKRATGTGLGGTVRRFLRSTDTRREAKTEDFKAKAKDLIHLGKEIDRLIQSHPTTGVQEGWREIQRNLTRLASLT